MAPKTKKSKAARRNSERTSESKVTVDRGEQKSGSFLDKIQTDLEKNQSYLNLILGALIVVVLGVLIFNYFNKPSDDPGDIGPSAQVTDEAGDVTKEGLPGSYTVKEGDTLFTIAQKYYDDGNKYTEILKENSLPNEAINAGQKLTIPKLADSAAQSSASPEASATASPSSSPEQLASVKPTAAPSASPSEVPAPAGGKGGVMNQAAWGEPISGDTYTVVKGDWLSTISGRAYGDIMQYEKLAKANNISDPNTIEVGTVLKIPRN